MTGLSFLKQYFQFLFKLRSTLAQNASIAYVTINVNFFMVCIRLVFVAIFFLLYMYMISSFVLKLDALYCVYLEAGKVLDLLSLHNLGLNFF